MITGIGHLGIVVKDIRETLEVFSKFVRFEDPSIREVSEKGVRVAVVQAGNVGFELFEDLQLDGPLAKTVAEKGNFIHHFCLLSDNIEEDVASLVAQGVEMMDPEPKIGLRGKKMAMTTPRVLNGVSIELSEP